MLDGHTLSIAAVAAAARYDAGVELDDSPLVKDRLLQSRQVVADKVEQGTSIYGVTTGFGGSGRNTIGSSTSDAYAHILIT